MGVCSGSALEPEWPGSRSLPVARLPALTLDLHSLVQILPATHSLCEFGQMNHSASPHL